MDPSDDEQRALNFAAHIDRYVREARIAMAFASGVPAEHVDSHVRDATTVEPTVRAYINGPMYQQDGVGRVSAHASDLHLQFHFLYCAGAQHNILIWDNLNRHGLDGRKPGSWPADIRLMAAALDQDLVGKSRILWERVMNLAYVMQLGRIPKYGKSKRGHFFSKFVPANPRWSWFSAFEGAVTQLDASQRTPEFHSGSFIRSDLLQASRSEIGHGVDGMSEAAVWHAFQRIAGGSEPEQFSGAHMPLLGFD